MSVLRRGALFHDQRDRFGVTSPDLFILIVAFVVGLSKGGFATVGALAVPLLALRMDALTAAALLLPIFIVSDIVGVWLFRRDFDRRNHAILLPAGLAGVAVATALAPFLPPEAFLLATGVIGLVYCLRAWFGAGRRGPARPADLPRGIFWGMMTGISSFISHSGSPPFQTYVLPQKLPKMVFAGTTTITFTVLNLSKLPAYWSIGLFERIDPSLLGSLVVAAVAGTFAGNRLTRLLPERVYGLTIQIALFVLSIRLVWDGARSLAA
ncbi:MAG: sulfite exporter TauE/SafE family protein [Tropicimonas sp.]|uniref:sulfite exporter TauE/SafE family protein n=1 Tax=Tropicimonas sp. TaxID=2067044 RepID=UPI003A86B6F0